MNNYKQAKRRSEVGERIVKITFLFYPIFEPPIFAMEANMYFTLLH